MYDFTDSGFSGEGLPDSFDTGGGYSLDVSSLPTVTDDSTITAGTWNNPTGDVVDNTGTVTDNSDNSGSTSTLQGISSVAQGLAGIAKSIGSLFTGGSGLNIDIGEGGTGGVEGLPTSGTATNSGLSGAVSQLGTTLKSTLSSLMPLLPWVLIAFVGYFVLKSFKKKK